MLIHGREVNFLRTVKAACDIAKICPDENLANIGKVFSSKATPELTDSAVVFILAMNNGYEMSRKFEDSEYKANPLTKEELEVLPQETFDLLFAEAVNAFYGDKVTVEVEEEKSKKKGKKAAVTSD